MLLSESKGLQNRPYQTAAWKNMTVFTKKRLRDELTKDNTAILPTSAPVWMATGSGKTATVGTHINYMYRARDVLEKLHRKDYPVRTLVLNDRINLINQLKTDCIDGRDGKKPLFGQDILEHAHVRVFHSKIDSTEDLQVEDGVDEYGNQSTKDEVYFSTFGSQPKFAKEQEGRDIIMIDEAHHLTGKTYMKKLQHEMAKSLKYKGRLPLIIPMSATMEPILHLINDPVVKFHLPEWIASEYSPDVSYNLVTNADFDQAQLQEVKAWIDRVSDITDINEKKKEISAIREHIESHLASFGNLQDLCRDMLDRISELDHTIIFASSIAEVDEIVAEINYLSGDDNMAVALHSKIDEADAAILNEYNSGKKKIIVAVDKLNEGIDMPQTNNVVFWRNTKSPTIFQQQFGRGLRGEKVNFYDYTGVLGNMAWVNGINAEVDEIIAEEIEEQGTQNTQERASVKRRGIDVLIGDIQVNTSAVEHKVDLGDLITRAVDIEGECLEITKKSLASPDNVKEYFGKIGYDVLVKYSKNEIKSIKYKGHGIVALAKISGFKSKYSLSPQTPSGFQEYVGHMFGKNFVSVMKEIPLGTLKKYFKQIGYERLMKYTHEQIVTIKYSGHGIQALATISGFKSLYNLRITTPAGFQEYISFVFGKDFISANEKKEKTTSEDIKKYFEEEGYEKLMGYTKNEIKSIKHKGHGIVALAKISGFKSKYSLSLQTPSGFQEYMGHMFGKVFVFATQKKEATEKREDVTGESVSEYFEEIGYEKLMSYTSKEIRLIRYKGHSVTSLATISGFKSLYNLGIITSIWFQEYMSHVFGKDFVFVNEKKEEITGESVREYFEKIGYEKLMRYGKNQIQAIKYQGRGIRALAKISGFRTQYDLKIELIIGFQEYISFVFGKAFIYKR